MKTCCSIPMLEAALAGNLPADEEGALQRHLAECEQCGAALERLAGGASWCQEAAALLKDDNLDQTATFQGEWSEVDFSVDHLEPSDKPGTLGRLGGYDVLEIIGNGGMGVVLKAFDGELKRCVAIKLLAPHLAHSSLAKKRFTREAQAAAAVVHPHVLPIHHVQPNGRLPFFVMPLVAGESLAERIKAQGSLELKEILRIGMQAAAGLAAAHDQGLVHRDVKPANILLEKGVERAMLMDFGLARATDDDTLSRWGAIAGTPQYMSPEQAKGEPLDGRSDLFSLGCVLYEMASGVSPFRADSAMATMRRLVEEPPQSLASVNAELPPWFIGIVDRLLEKDPARRFGSAKEVSELLEGCLAHVQQPANVPLPAALPQPVVQPKSRRRKPLVIGVMAMIATLAISLFAFVMQPTPPSPPPPDISGQWTVPDWGTVDLKKLSNAEYSGTYTVANKPGEIQLKWSPTEQRFNGTWREGEDRFGELSVRLDGNVIRGALTTDAKSKINPATPRLADLMWVKGQAAETVAELPANENKKDSQQPSTLKGWGTVVNPKADCAFALKSNQLAVTLPKGNHNLWATNLDAPRVLREVEGDFALEVRVTRFPLPEEIKKLDAKAQQVTAGLVLWQDEQNFTRIQLHYWHRYPNKLAVQVQRQGGFPTGTLATGADWGNNVQLRMQRKGNTMTLAYLNESKKDQGWVQLFEYAAAMPEKLKAGVFACNDTAATILLHFAELKLTPASKQPPAKADFGAIDPKVLAAWEKVGAKLEWGNSIAPVSLAAPRPKVGAVYSTKVVESFRFAKVPQGMIANLPEPSQPWGLHLSAGKTTSLITDKSLKELAKDLAGFRQLTLIDLKGNPVTDAGLKELAKLKNLQQLGLAETQVTDAGLKDLAALKDLKVLSLSRTKVTSSGVKELAVLDDLRVLMLDNTKVGDAGLKHLAGLKNLQMLGLDNAYVSNAGLKELVGLKSLMVLYLRNNKVTDEGLKEIAKLNNLLYVELASVGLTLAGVAELRKALPNANIVISALKGDGMRPNEKKTPDKADFGGIDPQVVAAWEKAGAKFDLPANGLPRFWFPRVPQGSIASLPAPAVPFVLDFSTFVDNGKTRNADAGLKELARFKQLEELRLNANPVTDAGLKSLASLKSLRSLMLDNTNVTDAGLKELADLKDLRVLRLPGTKVTDAGLKHLVVFEHLEALNLSETQVTDAALKELVGLKQLKRLQVLETLVTPAGVAELQKALPNTEIQYGKRKSLGKKGG